MTYYVKSIPPSKRARVHKGGCKHCNEGFGQVNQDKGTGPTKWDGPFSSFDDADRFMRTTFPRYRDVGECAYCKPSVQ